MPEQVTATSRAPLAQRSPSQTELRRTTVRDVMTTLRWATRSTKRPKAAGTTGAVHRIVRTPPAH